MALLFFIFTVDTITDVPFCTAAPPAPTYAQQMFLSDCLVLEMHQRARQALGLEGLPSGCYRAVGERSQRPWSSREAPDPACSGAGWWSRKASGNMAFNKVCFLLGTPNVKSPSFPPL